MNSIQETGNHNPSDNEFEEWRQVLIFFRDNLAENLVMLICKIFSTFFYLNLTTFRNYPTLHTKELSLSIKH